jgi:hypothetical protein
MKTTNALCETQSFNNHHHTVVQGLLQGRGQQARMLNVHEYIGMDIMKSFGIDTPAVR